MSKHCSLCGNEIKENETVCSFCGPQVSGAAEKPAAAQVPSPIPVPASPAIPSAPTLTPSAAARMIEKHVCSGCKKEYHDGTKFCPECGGKIELVQVSVPAPAPAPGTFLPGKMVTKHICSGCGREYPNGGKFCPECGGKIEEKTIEEKSDVIVKIVKEKKIVCSGCGREYPNGGKFCPECGGKIGEKEFEKQAFFRIREIKKIVCSGCGREYPSGGKFCPECGGKIAETTVQEEIPVKIREVTKHICSGCGREYPNGGKFCPECGGKIEEKTFQVPDDDGSDTKSARKDNEKAAVKKTAPTGSPEEIERCKKENTYDAWCRIGHIYQKGDGVPVDMGKALEAYRTAASMNECHGGEYSENGYAECYIGYFYKSGNQVPKDIDAAAKWFRIATDCGNEYAEAELEKYIEDKEFHNQYSDLIEFYKQENDYDAWCKIGHIYQKGFGDVRMDMSKALEAYRKAAALNDYDEETEEYPEDGYAECYLGYFHKSGNCVPKDIQKARKWFQIAADCGNEYGQYALNTLHNQSCECSRKGNVERDNQKNYPAALEWYKKALELDPGYDWPKFNIGYCYMNGYGVNKDGVRAIEWYEKADNYTSWGWIGYMYQYGCSSVAKNISKSLEAYGKAVSMNKPNNYGSYQENGWVERQLGLIYKNGDGISQDMEKAVKWFKIAAKCRDKPAQEELSKLGYRNNGNGDWIK